MYRKWIGPHTCLNHLLSASGWDWAVLTSLCDIPVILMVTSPICLSFPNFLGDGRESTVISFCHFPSLMQFVLIRLANISTALQTCLSSHCRHFPQWKNPHLNQALFKQRSNFACGAQLWVCCPQGIRLHYHHPQRPYLITWTCSVSMFKLFKNVRK